MINADKRFAECGRQRYADAVSLLMHGRQLDAAYQPFLDNDLHVHHRWVTSLCKTRRFTEALEILESGRRRRPEVELFDEGRLTIYRIWIQTLVRDGRRERAIEIAQQAARQFPDQAKRLSALITLVPLGDTNHGYHNRKSTR